MDQKILPLALNQSTFSECIQHLENILSEYKTLINKDYQGYLNHCIRMAGCCLMLSQKQDPESIHKIAIAAAFHDIGIWTANTLDYLPPSIEALNQYLAAHQLIHFQEELSLMITEHHKLSSTHYPKYPLVEYFRQADYADFSLGIIRFGIPLNAYKQLKSTYPNAGFHKTLFYLGIKRFFRKPWNPLPMFKW